MILPLSLLRSLHLGPQNANAPSLPSTTPHPTPPHVNPCAMLPCFCLQRSAGASPAPGAELHHHTPTTAAQALHANGGQHHHGDEAAAAAAAADQAEANCDRCGRTHPEDGGDGGGDGDGALGDEDSDGDVEDGAHSGGAARALAPGPPPGPSGFSSPLARTAVVKQPLGQKVVLAWEFSVREGT